MKRARWLLFALIAIVLAAIVVGNWLGPMQLEVKVPLLAAKPPVVVEPTPIWQRQSAQLPDLRKSPSEEPLMAEVRDVAPIFTSIGSIYFIGEIVNTGRRPLAKPEVIIALKDAAGKPLLFGTGYPVHDLVLPGGSVPVVVLFTNPPPDWRSFEVYLQGRAPTGREFLSYTAFSYTDVQISTDEFSAYIFTGQVKNTGPSKAEFTQVLLSLYGADDKIVGMGTAYTDLSAIDPGETSSFTVRVSNVLADAKYYRLQFVAHPK